MIGKIWDESEEIRGNKKDKVRVERQEGKEEEKKERQGENKKKNKIYLHHGEMG